MVKTQNIEIRPKSGFRVFFVHLQADSALAVAPVNSLSRQPAILSNHLRQEPYLAHSSCERLRPYHLAHLWEVSSRPGDIIEEKVRTCQEFEKRKCSKINDDDFSSIRKCSELNFKIRNWRFGSFKKS